ncbi:EF-hand calcium-binding domain-containing protein 3-like [Tenrec ecaudatus]|uniref:EF-hand calcium-binding domain-containing protein 3-like n=1 Tax=Tenrec ecaudatus TaxID=94439 RepID=UPI003F5AA32A
MGTDQPMLGSRKFKGLRIPNPGQPQPSLWSNSLTKGNLTPRQLAAFQDIFKMLSSSPAGTVDMRSLRAALSLVGIHRSPQEICEALRQADLDGDGTVSFQDFLGVLTDTHRFAQCLGEGQGRRLYDPQGLRTLFFEILLKLLGRGSLPTKSLQEVVSYYSKKQQALRLNPGWMGQPRDRSPHALAGLSFFCQAARVSGLSNGQLARSLHRLHQAGARSPYSQIPNLAARTRPERKMSRLPRPEVRPPRAYQPSRPKSRGRLRLLSRRFAVHPPECAHFWKPPPSPPTLVQKEPPSPPPACVQSLALRSLNK